MVKKFKNGKIVIRFDKGCNDIDELYNGDMFFNDLYIQEIECNQYVVDYNTSLVYSLGSYLLQNPLKFIKDSIIEDGKFVLYPLSKNESKELFNILLLEDCG